jgi:hypothetical protein
MTIMSFIASLCAFLLGSLVGCVGGVILGFVWYERKSGLLADPSGQRAAEIRFELDDVFARRGAAIEVKVSQDAKMRHPEHSTTSSIWEKRMGNTDISAMRNVSGRPAGGDGPVLVSHD